MALLIASRPPVSQGQLTATIYGHLKEGRYDEAIQILEWELQVLAVYPCNKLVQNQTDQQDHQPASKLLLTNLIASRLLLHSIIIAAAEFPHKPSSAVFAGICTVSG